jgi:hypothetical protein
LDPKDGELCLNRVKPEETLVEARSGSDVQIDRQIWAWGRKTNRTIKRVTCAARWLRGSREAPLAAPPPPGGARRHCQIAGDSLIEAESTAAPRKGGCAPAGNAAGDGKKLEALG